MEISSRSTQIANSCNYLRSQLTCQTKVYVFDLIVPVLFRIQGCFEWLRGMFQCNTPPTCFAVISLQVDSWNAIKRTIQFACWFLRPASKQGSWNGNPLKIHEFFNCQEGVPYKRLKYDIVDSWSLDFGKPVEGASLCVAGYLPQILDTSPNWVA